MKNNRMRFIVMLLTSVVVLVSPSFAEYVVISSQDNVPALSKQQVCTLFLSKDSKVNGEHYAVFLPSEKMLIEGFYLDVCGKKISQVRRKWAQLVFSGRQNVSPPTKIENIDVFLTASQQYKSLLFTNVESLVGKENINIVYKNP